MAKPGQKHPCSDPLYYGPGDVSFEYRRDLGDPGEYPYSRGIYRGMYRSRLWTMRQYAGYATAEESNERYRYLLSQGTTGLSVAFDLPTQIGLDSDDPLAAGEVGRVGVAIDTVGDLQKLFRDIPLDQVSTSMTINATAPILLAFYLVLARRRNVAWEKLRGTIQNDILKEYIARGTYIYPPKPSLRLVTDVFAFCREHVPAWNTISVSGYHIREAGSSAAQEIAFTLANARTYVEAALDSGLQLDEFAPRISFFFAAHNDLFEEVAKFRAARRLWAEIMSREYGARSKKACQMRFHVQTAGSTLTAQQPENNVVRVAIQALAAVLGGTQSLHTNGKDEALALPTTESARLALRTQQIIASESGVTQVADPLGGAWFLEALTGRLAQEARQYMARIQSLGGVLAALEAGYIQSEIQEVSYRSQQALENETQKVVGLNCYQEEGQPIGIKRFRVDEQVEGRQLDRLRKARQDRDQSRVRLALERLRSIAEGDGNLVHPMIGAAEEGATIGEIAGQLGKVFGRYQESVAL